MPPSESLAAQVRDTGAVAGSTAGTFVDVAQQVHDAVAARAYRVVGPVAQPVRAVHTGIAGALFGAARAAHRRLPAAAGAAAAVFVPPDLPPVGERGPAAHVLAAAGGIYGDRIQEAWPSLAAPTTLRHEGAVVDPTRAALRATFPDATDRLVVFVHGLCLTEHSWRVPHAGERPDEVDYGRSLRRDLGVTPLYVRYTSGQHVSHNGTDVSALLDKVVAAWPVPVKSVALVGHSMGGLVARSTAHHAAADELAWAPLISHVVALGSPHLGSPVEQGVNVASWALGHVPESRPFARLLDARSDGVKDLRFGSVVRTDWHGHNPDELLRDRCGHHPFLEHARYHYVASTSSHSVEGLWARVVGDSLVRVTSASGAGRRRRLPFEAEDGAVLAGVSHLGLLRHPDVYELLLRWLDLPPPAVGSDEFYD